MSYGTIEKISELGKSTIHSWAGDVVPEPYPNPNDGQQPAPQANALNPERSVIPETIPGDGNGVEGQGGQRIPRVNSEIVSSRPRIVEDYDGDSVDSASSTGMANGTGDGATQTTSSPIDMDLLRILSRDPRWVDVYLSIRAGARHAGVSDPVVYFNRHMWQDSRDMELVRTLVPYDPDEPESLLQNLETIARKANLLDEATKRSGLTAEPQHRKGVDT